MRIAQYLANGASAVRKSVAASWDALLFLVSIMILSYAAGVATAHFRLPPYNQLTEIETGAKNWAENWRMKLGIEPTQHLGAARHAGAGLVQYDERSNPGVTLMESVFDGRVGLRLFDQQGNVLHTWDALYSEIAPSTEHPSLSGIPTNDWETLVHGAALLANGHVLFNLSGHALILMNPCGDPDWVLPIPAHHSIHIADDGNIWTLSRNYYEERVDKFPGMRPRFEDNLVLEVSPEGDILREISLLEILYANDLIGSIFPTGNALVDGYPMRDVLHTNDVEILSRDDAAAFPLFEAGDAMVSFRNLNLIVVFDPDSGVVKWSQTGPWLRQHDPDFLPDGRILVFDNRDDGADGRLLDGSRLLAIDPVTRDVETIHEGTPAAPFFTSGRGEADVLENGNYLVTETAAGRVFEVTPDGDIVWSFIHRYDADRILYINGASRYPASFGVFDDGDCS
jgi:hypothetical protein